MNTLHLVLILIFAVLITGSSVFAQNVTNSSSSIPSDAIRTPNGGWVTSLQTHEKNGTKLTIHYEVGTPIIGNYPPPPPPPHIFSNKKINNNALISPALHVPPPPDVLQTLPPLVQLNYGVPAKDVKCKQGLQLVIKAEDGSPACVKPDTAQKLIERGWGTLRGVQIFLPYGNTNSTTNVPDFKIGPDLLGPIPHQLVFFMNSNSTAKIFAEYKSSLDNTGTLPTYSRVYVGNTTYTPLTTQDVTISANPSSVPLVKGSDTTVVYSITAKEGVKGVYWIFLVQFCRVMPLAVGIDDLTISPSEIPVQTGTMSCPAQFLDANILGVSNGKAEYKIGIPVR